MNTSLANHIRLTREVSVVNKISSEVHLYKRDNQPRYYPCNKHAYNSYTQGDAVRILSSHFPE